jgi:hypothetical protein
MNNFDVAAYIWPSYHREPRTEHFWPEKDGEWYTVRRGHPRFDGHDMPRIPLLGHQDEADPKVMREHVELAMAHGINVFIMDWYWYENAPCFERQLNEGLLPAIEGTQCKFYLMWANHDVTSLWNMHEDTDWNHELDVLWSGKVPRNVLEPMFDRIIEKYLGHENYYHLHGKPVFSVFDPPGLIKGLGGLQETRETMNWMRNRCSEKGLPGLDLQGIARSHDGVESSDSSNSQGKSDAEELGFDSATSYQHLMDCGASTGDYVLWTEHSRQQWPRYEEIYGTYYPHISVGWDNTHRNPSFGVDHVVTNTTPEAFEACLWKARQWLEARPSQPPLLTINSWNEWTEGSYLLPDMRWGYGYLQAVRNVFGSKSLS